jgi:cysteine-S-conjugate beta-lyase
MDTTIYDFDTPLDRRGTNSIKWDNIQMFYPHAPVDALPLWVADMDLPAAKPIVDALHRRVDHPVYGYTLHQTPDYLNSVTSWLKNQFSWDVPKDHIVFSPGIMKAVAHFIRLFTKQGDGVIVQRPVYGHFFHLIERNHRKVVSNSLICKNGHFEMDFEDLEAKAKIPENKLFLFCSPHNPVGRVWTKEELRRMVEICVENDVLIFSDEIHFDILRKGIRHHPLGKLFEQYKEHIVVATAPSKTFNIPGLHMANLVIPSELIKQKFTNELLGLAIYGSSLFSAIATKAAYDQGLNWLTQLNKYLDKNVLFLEKQIEQKLPKAKFYRPEGSYLAWVDLKNYNLTHKELIDLFLHKAKLVLSDGKSFGQEGDKFMRINFGCPQSTIKECIDRMTRVLPT